MTIETVAVRSPSADGLKVTVKVVGTLEDTVELPAADAVKSPAFVPPMVIVPTLNDPVPVF
ncbi:hypothetical protein N8703_05950 [Verrucomicrobia bacterium]|nr:hypothetical protein [Verrucomicrobiota bacterium]